MSLNNFSLVYLWLNYEPEALDSLDQMRTGRFQQIAEIVPRWRFPK